MKIVSIFEKNGTTFVKDDKGNTYSLQKVEAPTCDDFEPINTVVQDIDLDLIAKIKEMLISLDVPFEHSGTKILLHCIYFAIKDKKCRTRLYVNLYPKVAKLHNIMSSSVPSSLTTPICHWGRSEKYKELFGNKTVSPKVLILSLADYFETYK